MDFLIHHLLRTSALRFPEKEALVHKGQRLTYGDVARLVEGLAQGLRWAGVRRGDRVGIYLDHSIPQAISIFGVSKAGGVFVPINGVLFPEQVAYIAADCHMRGLITNASKLPSLAPVLKDAPALEFIVAVADGGAAEASLLVYPFEDLCQHAAAVPCCDVAIDKDLAAIIYTSGSTGKPKGVMLSHAQVLAGSGIVSTYLEITAEDRILSVLPFQLRRWPQPTHDGVPAGGNACIKKLCLRPRNRADAPPGGHHGHGGSSHPVEPLGPTQLFLTQARLPPPPLHHEYRRAYAAERTGDAAPGPADDQDLFDVWTDRSLPLHLLAARAARSSSDLDRKSHPQHGNSGD